MINSTSTISVEARMESNASSLEEVEKWEENTIIVLDHETDKLIDLYVGDKLFGKGKLVKTNNRYAIQIKELSSPK